ncbi:MAG TPA: ATP-binding protein, partial [bacterium]|nr:ATP-binding protein [bacterium]
TLRRELPKSAAEVLINSRSKKWEKPRPLSEEEREKIRPSIPDWSKSRNKAAKEGAIMAAMAELKRVNRRRYIPFAFVVEALGISEKALADFFFRTLRKEPMDLDIIPYRWSTEAILLRVLNAVVENMRENPGSEEIFTHNNLEQYLGRAWEEINRTIRKLIPGKEPPVVLAERFGIFPDTQMKNTRSLREAMAKRFLEKNKIFETPFALYAAMKIHPRGHEGPAAVSVPAPGEEALFKIVGGKEHFEKEGIAHERFEVKLSRDMGARDLWHALRKVYPEAYVYQIFLQQGEKVSEIVGPRQKNFRAGLAKEDKITVVMIPRMALEMFENVSTPVPAGAGLLKFTVQIKRDTGVSRLWRALDQWLNHYEDPLIKYARIEQILDPSGNIISAESSQQPELQLHKGSIFTIVVEPVKRRSEARHAPSEIISDIIPLLRQAPQMRNLGILEAALHEASESKLRHFHLLAAIAWLIHHGEVLGQAVQDKLLWSKRSFDKDSEPNLYIDYLLNFLDREEVWAEFSESAHDGHFFHFDFLRYFDEMVPEKDKPGSSSAFSHALVRGLLSPDYADTDLLIQSAREVTGKQDLSYQDFLKPVLTMRVQAGGFQDVYLVMARLKNGEIAAFTLLAARNPQSSPVVKAEFENFMRFRGDPHAARVIGIASVKTRAGNYEGFTSHYLDGYEELMYVNRYEELVSHESPGSFNKNSDLPHRVGRIEGPSIIDVVAAFAKNSVHFYDPVTQKGIDFLSSRAGDLNFKNNQFKRIDRYRFIVDPAIKELDTKLIALRKFKSLDIPHWLQELFQLGYLSAAADGLVKGPPQDEWLIAGVFKGLLRGVSEKYGPKNGRKKTIEWLRLYLKALNAGDPGLSETPLFSKAKIRNFIRQLKSNRPSARSEARSDLGKETNAGNVFSVAGPANREGLLLQKPEERNSRLRTTSRSPALEPPSSVKPKDQKVKTQTEYTAEAEKRQGALRVENKSGHADRKEVQQGLPGILLLPMGEMKHDKQSSMNIQNNQQLFNYNEIARSEARGKIANLLKEHKTRIRGKNIFQTAEIMGVSQPGLSRHLQKHPEDFEIYGIEKGRRAEEKKSDKSSASPLGFGRPEVQEETFSFRELPDGVVVDVDYEPDPKLSERLDNRIKLANALQRELSEWLRPRDAQDAYDIVSHLRAGVEGRSRGGHPNPFKEFSYNALRAIEESQSKKGSIRLRIRQLDEHIHFEVLDTGDGISTAAWKSIGFKRKSLRPADSDGMGNGLYFSFRNFLKDFKGSEIKIWSQRHGQLTSYVYSFDEDNKIQRRSVSAEGEEDREQGFRTSFKLVFPSKDTLNRRRTPRAEVRLPACKAGSD